MCLSLVKGPTAHRRRLRNTIEQGFETLNNQGFCFEEAVAELSEGYVNREYISKVANEAAQRLGMERSDIRRQRLQREEAERFKLEIDQKLTKAIERIEIETRLPLEREKELKALKQEVATLREQTEQCQVRLNALEQEFATLREEMKSHHQHTQLSECED